MPIQATAKIWHNGNLIPWEQATLHVMSHVIHYGSSVFEGIRCYGQPHGSAIFRLPEHMQRLLDSAKIYRMEVPFTLEELCAAVVDTVEDRLRVALGLYRKQGKSATALVLAGGVAANTAMRATLSRFAQQSGMPMIAPPVRLCTDNGAMIAWAGLEKLRLGRTDDLAAPARARWPLDPKAERARNNKA